MAQQGRREGEKVEIEVEVGSAASSLLLRRLVVAAAAPMDLSEDIVKGLGLLSARKTADGSTALSDSAFERLANATFDILLRRSAEDVLDARTLSLDGSLAVAGSLAGSLSLSLIPRSAVSGARGRSVGDQAGVRGPRGLRGRGSQDQRRPAVHSVRVHVLLVWRARSLAGLLR